MTEVEWEQVKPGWCIHKDCIFLIHTQMKICSGRLPKPVEHDGDYNTHRVCICFGINDIFDFQVNRTDAFNLKRVLMKGVLND